MESPSPLTTDPAPTAEEVDGRPRPFVVARLLGVVLAAFSAAAWAGWGYLRFLDVMAPAGPSERTVPWLGALAVSCVTAGLGAWLLARVGRRLLFDLVLMGLLGLFSFGLLEAIARTRTPAWPLRDLHGTEAVWRAVDGEEKISRNSWGQVDRERTIRPAPGVRRVALVGDSFLDEIQGRSVAVLVEEFVGRSDIEVVNLGVSATGPDEYCYRTGRVALPLGARLCIQCVYLGNDLAADARTLGSCGGLLAVSPRGSVLTDLGGAGLNHLFTNEHRPVIRAWREGGSLVAREAAFHARIRAADDAGLARLLRERLGENLAEQGLGLPPECAVRLQNTLAGPRIAEFFAMLRQPDADKFRSYFLEDALVIAAYDQVPQPIFHDDFVQHWLRQSQRVCERGGAELAVVLIPEGFAVDPRLREQWGPLADMRRLTTETMRHADLLQRSLRETGIPVLNLAETLEGVAGTYLNVEGHWSEKGSELAGRAIGAWVREWAARAGP